MTDLSKQLAALRSGIDELDSELVSKIDFELDFELDFDIDFERECSKFSSPAFITAI